MTLEERQDAKRAYKRKWANANYRAQMASENAPKLIEERKAKRKAYYAANRERILNRQSAYKGHTRVPFVRLPPEVSKENERIAKKNWRKKNPEKIRQYAAKSRANRKEKARIERRAWYEKNKSHAKRYAKEYVLKNREASRLRKKNYNAEHAAENREAYKSWKLRNPEILKAARRRGKIKHHTRLLSAPGKYDDDKFFLRCEYFDWKCRYCGSQLNKKTVSPDHQIPLSRGGSNWPSNLVPACWPCNRAKHHRTPSEFRELLNHRSGTGSHVVIGYKRTRAAQAAGVQPGPVSVANISV